MMPSYSESNAIHLLWKNKKLDESQTFIFPCNSEKELCEQFLDHAKKWKEANPEATVTIWYDSKTVTKDALAATRSILAKKIEEDKSYNIQLRDIREIKIVQENPDVFSENIPIYFIVDILKFIICLHSIERDLNRASLFVDFGINAMSTEELFNPEIKEKLDKVGIQANGTENQFIQMVNRTATINATKVYINANLSRAITALNLVHLKLPNYEHAVSNLCTVVFEQMKNQLFYLCVANEGIKVKANLFNPEAAKEEWIDYDFVKHGCVPLGNYCVKCTQCAYVIRVENNDNVVFLGEYEINLMQFPKSTRAATQLCYRHDVKVRSGNDHSAPTEPLVCPPINGAKYECVYWKISEASQTFTFMKTHHSEMYNQKWVPEDKSHQNQLSYHRKGYGPGVVFE